MDLYNLDVIISVGYKERELEKAATTEDFSVVQLEGSRNIRRRASVGRL
jgi:hypothetical protein